MKNTGAHIAVNASGVSSTSRGLVGDTVFAVLPNVKPIQTFLVTLSFQIVSPLISLPAMVLLKVIPAIPRQALVRSYLQKFPNSNHVVWIRIIHVWMACS